MLAILALVAMTSAGPAAGPEGAEARDALRLIWSAPSGCPDGEVVRREALALVRQAGSVDARRGLVAEGTVAPHASGGFSLTLRFRGDPSSVAGERVLVGESCVVVSETAALLLALALDPRVLGGDVVPQPPSEPMAPAGAPPEPPPEPMAPAPAPVRAPGPAPPGVPVANARPRPSVGVRARGGVAVGLLRSAVPGGGLGLTLGRGRALGELYGATMGPAEVRSAANASIGGRFWAWSGGLRACGVIPLWRAGALGLTAPLCGLVEVGAVRGRGSGALEPRTARSAWAALGGAAALRLELLRWLALWLEAEGLVAVARPRFHTEPSGALWQLGRGGGRFSLGLEFRVGLRDRRPGGQAASRR